MEKKHKIITCASYGGSGSSIITDLLKEFDNCKSLGDFEFTFLHYPNGMLDLEDKVINNRHRLVSGYAIYKFEKEIKRLNKYYSRFFGINFMKLSKKFIQNLITIEWLGYNELFCVEENIFTKVKNKILNILFKMLKGEKEGRYYRDNKYPMYFSNISTKKFYSLVQEYICNLFDTVDPEYKYENLIFDQLVPSSNINRYLNYFDNIKIIVVDRDPRDIYILNKEFWHEGWIPEDIEIFMKWFKITREYDLNIEENEEKVLRIRFEDFIYNYECTLEEVLNFLNINKKNHVVPKKYFNNNISIKNTKLWLKYPKYHEDIFKIKNELSEYCYGK